MTEGDILGILAALALGVFLGWLLDRSRFNFDKVFRWPSAKGNREWMYAWLFALSVVWLAMGIAFLNHWCDVQKLPDIGPIASLLSGFLSGAAIGLLGQCPLTIVLGAGAMSLWALAAFASWAAGLLVGLHTVLAIPIVGIQGWLINYGWQGVSDFIGIPRWIVLLVFAVGFMVWMMRLPVSVRPKQMEWPKQGVLFGVAVSIGWLLALKGGNFGGLNLVEAVDDVWVGLTGGKLWLRPALLVSVGMAGWGFVRSIRMGKVFADPLKEWKPALALAGAAFLLGLAGALGKGCPLAHAFFGTGILHFGSLLFVAGMWGGGALMGRLGRAKGAA